MAQIVKDVGRFHVEVWTDGAPLWVKIVDTQNNTELRLLLPEDISDLQYALERLQFQIAPLVEADRERRR